MHINIEKVDNIITKVITTVFLLFIFVVAIVSIFSSGNFVSASNFDSMTTQGTNIVEVGMAEEADESDFTVVELLFFDDNNAIEEDCFTDDDQQEAALDSWLRVDPELQLALDLSYQLESSSGKKLVGDDGNAIGPLQTWKVVIDDVNRILDSNEYTYDDRWDLGKSCEVFWVYLTYYGQIYQDKTGKKPTVEVYVRIWNKGPNGWRDSRSLNHWRKAKEILQG